MEVRFIEESGQLNKFLIAQEYPSGSFLQSFEWSEFQKDYGRKIWRLGFFENSELIASALLVKYNLPLGKSYLYCPKGPVINKNFWESGNKFTIFESFIHKCREIARQENSLFFKFEPLCLPENFRELSEKFQVKEINSVQPQTTQVLDISGSEENIIAAMKQKTRYNIRLAQKKPVNIYTSVNPQIVKEFYRLANDTAARNKINVHPEKYYQKMVESYADKGKLKFYIAEYEEKNIAMNLMLYFGKTAVYLHGGSGDEYRNVMAPYLLHWQAIRDANKDGFKYYDFGGVAQNENPNDKWAGITRFKKGFGGFEVNTAGTFDYAIKPVWYRLYKFIKRFR